MISWHDNELDSRAVFSRNERVSLDLATICLLLRFGELAEQEEVGLQS